MRAPLLFILTFFTTHLWAQKGYVLLDNDSILSGYIRYYMSAKDGHQGFEIWETKHDKDPQKIPKATVREYAIKNDTFKIFRQYAPFPDRRIYFEQVDAKLLESGKINLYAIEIAQPTPIPTPDGGASVSVAIRVYPWQQPYIYILEDKKSGFHKALPSDREDLKETLMEFYPERYVIKYDEVKGKIKYSEVPDIVRLYNSK
jgi:hypothetical protein